MHHQEQQTAQHRIHDATMNSCMLHLPEASVSDCNVAGSGVRAHHVQDCHQRQLVAWNLWHACSSRLSRRKGTGECRTG